MTMYVQVTTNTIVIKMYPLASLTSYLYDGTKSEKTTKQYDMSMTTISLTHSLMLSIFD